jgi:hypothetical protein
MQSLLSALGIYNFSNAFGVRSSAREERFVTTASSFK